jgi:hypothetical protein
MTSVLRSLLDLFFPAAAGNTIRGSRLPYYVLILVAMLGTVRSFIHLLAPDGGAGSIAGMDLTVTGASGIVFAFALWGSAQLIYALLQWLVILRYRSLVPFMWLVQLLETLLREFVGQTKPVTFSHTPPGAIGNQIYLPLELLMLALLVWSARRQSGSSGGGGNSTEGGN